LAGKKRERDEEQAEGSHVRQDDAPDTHAIAQVAEERRHDATVMPMTP
jgi:hypothetical protein